MELVLDRSFTSDEFPALRDHQVDATERPTRSHRSRWPYFDLVITATLEGRTARHRPLLATGLHLADYDAPMEDLPKPYPFGLEGVGSTY